MSCMPQENISTPKFPVKGYRVWPEIRGELLAALKKYKRKHPRTRELDALHAAMLMWSRADESVQRKWVSVARASGQDLGEDADLTAKGIAQALQSHGEHPKGRASKGRKASEG